MLSVGGFLPTREPVTPLEQPKNAQDGQTGGLLLSGRQRGLAAAPIQQRNKPADVIQSSGIWDDTETSQTNHEEQPSPTFIRPQTYSQIQSGPSRPQPPRNPQKPPHPRGVHAKVQEPIALPAKTYIQSLLCIPTPHSPAKNTPLDPSP